MRALISSRTIVAGYIVAVVVLTLGLYASLRIGIDPEATWLARAAYFGAIGIVMKFTFELGRRRGFPARDGEGRLNFTNVARNLVACVIAFGCVVFASAPFIVALAYADR